MYIFSVLYKTSVEMRWVSSGASGSFDVMRYIYFQKIQSGSPYVKIVANRDTKEEKTIIEFKITDLDQSCLVLRSI